MKFHTLFLGLTLAMSNVNASHVIDFNQASNINQWSIVNDGVMGGMSEGFVTLNEKNQAVFSGKVSLDNYGGFTSVRYQPNKIIKLPKDKKVTIRLKGDGKKYQFRVKESTNDRHSYITHFSTSGEWQTITFDLLKMYPAYRGRNLDMPNFSHEEISEITFLIANQKVESFKLILETINVH